MKVKIEVAGLTFDAINALREQTNEKDFEEAARLLKKHLEKVIEDEREKFKDNLY